MMMILSILFIGSTQPIMMVVSLIFITLFYSYWMMKVMMSFWFSYALIMVMLSGVFVVFVYMVSLSPNEEFEIYSMIFVVIFMFMFFIRTEVLMGAKIYEWISLNLWMSYLGGFLLFLGLVLFIIMLMVVGISCKNEGALRVI